MERRLSLFSREYWRILGIALRRARRDKRDRIYAIRTIFSLVICSLYLGVISYGIFNDPSKGPYFAFGGIGFIAFLIYWISAQLDKRAAKREEEAQTDQALRGEIAAFAFGLAVLFSRAGSEQVLKEKEMPLEIEVITRRVHLEKLRSLSLWETLPATLRNLLLMPDGHCAKEQVYELPPRFEVLRCLRWVLQVDEKLIPLPSIPKINYGNAKELVDTPDRILTTRKLLPSWDIRVERNAAQLYFFRLFAEIVKRGHVFTEISDETKKWAEEVHEEASDNTFRDQMAGADTIIELDDELLRYVTSTSLRRSTTLEILTNLVIEKEQDKRQLLWQRLENEALP